MCASILREVSETEGVNGKTQTLRACRSVCPHSRGSPLSLDRAAEFGQGMARGLFQAQVETGRIEIEVAICRRRHIDGCGGGLMVDLAGSRLIAGNDRRAIGRPAFRRAHDHDER